MDNGQYLRPMLNAGSSRVFNCNDIVNALHARKAEAPDFFQHPALNQVVLIKEAIKRDDPPHPRGVAIGTKLYLPYNPANVYEGGRTIFAHSNVLGRVLHEHFGLERRNGTTNRFDHDLRVLETLDKLPSLDGFLMRDALALESMSANEQYFEVSDSERNMIQEFIRRKMEMLVRAANGGKQGSSQQVTSLIDKIWEAKDLEALDPLIQAFRFPRDKALSIFSGWKGIIFYSFEYHNGRGDRTAFANWLKNDAKPKDIVPKDAREAIESSRQLVIGRLRTHWKGADAQLQGFDALYDKFVTSMNPGGFIDFLMGASEVYWHLGDSLSKISHAINCWNIVTKDYEGRRLGFEKLERLFEAITPILALTSLNLQAKAA